MTLENRRLKVFGLGKDWGFTHCVRVRVCEARPTYTNVKVIMETPEYQRMQDYKIFIMCSTRFKVKLIWTNKTSCVLFRWQSCRGECGKAFGSRRQWQHDEGASGVGPELKNLGLHCWISVLLKFICHICHFHFEIIKCITLFVTGTPS